jgi:hypothetical protein
MAMNPKSDKTDTRLSNKNAFHRSSDHEELIHHDFRQQVARRLSFFLLIIFVSGSIFRHFSAPLSQELILANMITAFCLACNFILTYVNVPIIIPSVGIMISLTSMASVGGYMNAGVMAPVNAILISIPLIGYFFGGIRLGFIGLVLSLTVLWSEYMLFPVKDLNQVNHPELYTRYKSVVYSAIILFSAMIGVAYEKARRISQKSLQILYKKNMELENFRSLGHLASGVAHEINNPLAVIQSRIQLLKRQGPPFGSRSFSKTTDSHRRIFESREFHRQ